MCVYHMLYTKMDDMTAPQKWSQNAKATAWSLTYPPPCWWTWPNIKSWRTRHRHFSHRWFLLLKVVLIILTFLQNLFWILIKPCYKNWVKHDWQLRPTHNCACVGGTLLPHLHLQIAAAQTRPPNDALWCKLGRKRRHVVQLLYIQSTVCLWCVCIYVRKRKRLLQ